VLKTATFDAYQPGVKARIAWRDFKGGALALWISLCQSCLPSHEDWGTYDFKDREAFGFLNYQEHRIK